MKYFWAHNKVAEVWFRNKRKPPEHSHKLITDLSYAPSLLQFGSPTCMKLFGQQTPTVDKFAILRLTKSYGGYSARGSIFVNHSSVISNVKQYCFEKRESVVLPGLFHIFDVIFHTYDYTYHINLWGCRKDAKDENESTAIKARLNEDNKLLYLDLLMEMPDIAGELFKAIPEIKRKKN